MKTTIEISDSLFEEAKSWAAARGVSLRHVVEEGLRTILQTRESQAPFRLRNGSFGEPDQHDTRPWAEIRELIYGGRGE
jgi:hypothetical protein